MKTTGKRTLSIVLALSLIVTLLSSLAVLAEEPATTTTFPEYYTQYEQVPGDGKLVGTDSNVSFKWDENNIDDGTDVIPYTYTSNSVSFETSGVEMTFTK